MAAVTETSMPGSTGLRCRLNQLNICYHRSMLVFDHDWIYVNCWTWLNICRWWMLTMIDCMVNVENDWTFDALNMIEFMFVVEHDWKYVDCWTWLNICWLLNMIWIYVDCWTWLNIHILIIEHDWIYIVIVNNDWMNYCDCWTWLNIYIDNWTWLNIYWLSNIKYNVNCLT